MLKFVNCDIVFQEIPDEVTLAINLSNCPIGCTGCHSPFLKTDIGTPLTKEVLATLLDQYGHGITCVCFMGGDLSPDEIVQLAYYIQEESSVKLHVGWYSGKECLPETFSLHPFRYIKLGPYVESLGGLRSPTTNQRLYRVDNQSLSDITHFFWRDRAI